MLYYAGIGSRQTPNDVLEEMKSIAYQLAVQNWTLRSGFADGADMAFTEGADAANGEMEQYIPWVGFNNSPKKDDRFICLEPDEEQYAIAEYFHPNWKACSPAAKKLHARNVNQILGRDLDTPSKMVICWTPNGKAGGGTGQAIRIANYYEVPIFDLALAETRDKLNEFLLPF